LALLALSSQETGRDDKLKAVLIGSISGRKVKEADEGYQLRETSVPYKGNFTERKSGTAKADRMSDDLQSQWVRRW